MSDAMKALRAFSAPEWAQIPDLGLYMDQVITFIGRAYAPIYGPEVKRYLSPAMINNYVKARLIPRPTGKKYGREQIALLTMIVVLKQVAAMEDIRALLNTGEGGDVEALYAAFCGRFAGALKRIGEASVGDAAPALDYAISAAAYRAACDAAMADGGIQGS